MNAGNTRKPRPSASPLCCLVPCVNGEIRSGGSSGQVSPSHVDLLHIPSLAIGDFLSDINENISGVLFYEERMLCLLLHLNNPQNRVIYVTSMPVSPTVVDYYLSLLSNVSMEDAKRRLSMICCYDTMCTEPLALKILKRPRLMKRIKNQLSPSKTVISTYAHTEAEQEIARRLGINHALSPILPVWGTKSGSRIAFRELNIPHCVGTHDSVFSVQDLLKEVSVLMEHHPNLDTIMVKLNEGVSGYGNAKWKLPKSNNVQVLEESLMKDLQPASNKSPTEYLERLSELGGIVEEFLTHPGIRSPSAQGRVHDDGSVEVVSTHEQVLHNGIFDGCSFPAKEEYRLELQQHCLAVGKFLASKGIRDENYGVDFMAWQDKECGVGDDEKWHVSAIEINLRVLGTSHPMMTMKLVMVGGKMLETGDFTNRDGEPRCYFAVDSFQHECLSSLTPDDLFDLIDTHEVLQYHKESSTGTIFYMIDSLPSFGKVGFMCIQDTPANSLKLFEEVKELLLQECEGEPSLV